MFEVLANLKSWFLALFLKNYVTQGQTPRPKRYPEEKSYQDGWHFKDRYWERNADPETQEIYEKVMQAVSNLKAHGERWRGGE